MAQTTLLEVKTGPHILVRIAWYLLVGWWLTAIAMVVAWLAALTIIGLPLTFWLVNRMPTTLTLRPRREQYLMVTGPDGVTRMQRLSTQQTTLLVRIVYFVLVGWWASLLWMAASYVLMLTILGIPLGMMLVNRIPFVFSLHRGYA
ncbi:MAG: YccF domain-containing protein [Candidatus Limnocylindrales bacterium]